MSGVVYKGIAHTNACALTSLNRSKFIEVHVTPQTLYRSPSDSNHIYLSRMTSMNSDLDQWLYIGTHHNLCRSIQDRDKPFKLTPSLHKSMHVLFKRIGLRRIPIYQSINIIVLSRKNPFLAEPHDLSAFWTGRRGFLLSKNSSPFRQAGRRCQANPKLIRFRANNSRNGIPMDPQNILAWDLFSILPDTIDQTKPWWPLSENRSNNPP
jgi:hypothetical protein